MGWVLSDATLQALVEEDAPYGDPTTEGLGIALRKGRATFTAGADVVVACVEDVARMLEISGCRVETTLASGSRAARGTLLLEAWGSAADLHRTTRTGQVLLEIACGIATAAAAMVRAAHSANPDVVVACTRKHMPGAKAVALKAIIAGGAVPHRLGLSDSLLVFANHRAFLAEGESLAAAFRRLRIVAPERQVCAEAESEAEAVALAEAGADVVQIDKVPPETIARLAAILHARSPRVRLAAAGGITAANAAAYAAAGADLLVTSAPYYAPPRDVKLRLSQV